MISDLQSNWKWVCIARIIIVLRQVNFQVKHYYIKAFKLSAKEDINEWFSFEEMLLVCQIILTVLRDWMVHKLILKLNKSFYLSMKSILVSLHDETECWTFSWSVLENQSPWKLSLQSTCTFSLHALSNKTSVTKSIARDSNSLTRRQPLRIIFLTKSVTLGSSGSAILAALPVLW